jgi:Fe2+ or Zn2+ uptake regulation protein
MKSLTKQILADLKASGVRLTPIRQFMIDLLVTSGAPLSAPEILDTLHQKKITANKTTIYRELEFLVNKKIAEEVWLGSAPLRYEIKESHHHHLVCVKCRRVTDIEFESHLTEQEKTIYKTKKFKVLNHALEFFGLCNKCQ